MILFLEAGETMKNKSWKIKRIMAIFLSLCMLLTMLPTGLPAYGEPDSGSSGTSDYSSGDSNDSGGSYDSGGSDDSVESSGSGEVYGSGGSGDISDANLEEETDSTTIYEEPETDDPGIETEADVLEGETEEEDVFAITDTILCPVCGEEVEIIEEMQFDQEMLCPACGELIELEFVSFDTENAEQLAHDYALDEIIVKFKDPSQVPGRERQLRREISRVQKIGFVENLGLYIIKAEELSSDPNALLNRYKNNRYVEYVEPNYTMQVEFIPNDPNYKAQSLSLTVLNAPAGWDILKGSSTPVVAVIDSGVASHPDLPPLMPGYAAVAGLSPNNDTRGHGTGVAGTIGCVGNNGIGNAGINWNASIMPVKIDDAAGTISVANVAKGIIWATDNGAKVINLSLGYTTDSATLKNAIDYAYNKGCAIFAATGNESKNAVCYPARYANVMAVGSTGNGTTRLASSNYGAGMNVVALSSFSTVTPTGGYTTLSGTSFATPQVAALASLVWSLNPSLTNDQLYRLIESGCKTLGGGYNEQTGYGLIDIAKTLQLAGGVNSAAEAEAKAKAEAEAKAAAEAAAAAKAAAEAEAAAKAAAEAQAKAKAEAEAAAKAAAEAEAAAKAQAEAAAKAAAEAEAKAKAEAEAAAKAAAEAEAAAKAAAEAEAAAMAAAESEAAVKAAAEAEAAAKAAAEAEAAAKAAAEAAEKAAAEAAAKAAAESALHPAAVLPYGTKSLVLQAPPGERNNYNGSVGYEIEALADMTVTHLGRPLNDTMNETHMVYIWHVGTGSLIASGNVRPDSPLDAAGFKVVELAAPVTLKRGERYRIVSDETVGGDKWYDITDTFIMTLSADARFTTSVWANEGGFGVYPSNSLVPVGIRSHVGATFYYKLTGETAAAVNNEEEKAETEKLQPETPQEVRTAPVITLEGFTELTLEYDQKYVEMGYRAVDCKDVNLTASVVITNNVNVKSPGIYTVTYEVVDSAGLTARATRIVTVKTKPVVVTPPAAPKITINGSNPIILHQTSATPYKEQSAKAVDHDGTDISSQVVITGNVIRNVAGVYTLTYRITSPTSGLTAETTRNVRIVAPTEKKDPRTKYGLSGQAKAGAKVTHTGITSAAVGFMDLQVSSIDKNMTITTQLVDTATKQVIVKDTFTAAGTKQYRIDKSKYELVVLVDKASGNSKYAINLLMPETEVTYFFAEDEVPLTFLGPPKIAYIGSNPIILHLDSGTPYFEQGARAVDFDGKDISNRVQIFGEPVRNVPDTYIITYSVTNDLGLTAETSREVRILAPGEYEIGDEEVPLADLPGNEQPSSDAITYVVTKGDSLASIARSYGTTWQKIYEDNQAVIGGNPRLIFVGQVLVIMME